jgi:glycosyltransferase involved in cell wall biosynthesis
VRVLYLNPFSQEVSGPDESLLVLLSGLAPLGVEPHVVLPRPGPHVSRYVALGARVHYAPLTFLKRRLGMLELLSLPLRLARGVLAVARIARRERIDLIHTNMEVVLDGSLAALLLGLPHVLHYRGNTLDRPRVVFDVLTRFWTATSDRVFCISDATAEIFRRRGLGGRIDALYNPIDVEGFARAERLESVRAELGAGPSDLLVGTVGRIHPRKDIATFVRACAISAKDVANLRCVVVGSAEAPEELAYSRDVQTLAASVGLDVRWAGARRDMPSILKALDVFVLCSRNEGFGRVVAEASAAGTPMVLTREGALPEMAHGNAGAVLADAASPESFAAGIRTLTAGQYTRRSDAPAAVQRFALQGISARVWSTYQFLAPGR